ncbi:hypothetical protein Nepgr_011433 [Nepenthes gracilis]|uniref:Uncharacterized protein n=1 Tax=Nepenthes gracilis TaxID=150966 RepID=A0AAD3SEB9_NEPGR|nr:hypothetical protein Nepgr_011433 [Nepenthes gracilis]
MAGRHETALNPPQNRIPNLAGGQRRFSNTTAMASVFLGRQLRKMTSRRGIEEKRDRGSEGRNGEDGFRSEREEREGFFGRRGARR